MTTKSNTATKLASGTVHAEVPARTAAFPVRATVNDWCKLSGMGRSTTYEALGAGYLRAVKLGTRVLIDVPHGLVMLTRPRGVLGSLGDYGSVAAVSIAAS